MPKTHAAILPLAGSRGENVRSAGASIVGQESAMDGVGCGAGQLRPQARGVGGGGGGEEKDFSSCAEDVCCLTWSLTSLYMEETQK
jgi:hypothetical protein